MMHVTSLNLVRIAVMNDFFFHTIPVLNVYFLLQTELCFKVFSVYVMTWMAYQEGCTLHYWVFTRKIQT